MGGAKDLVATFDRDGHRLLKVHRDARVK